MKNCTPQDEKNFIALNEKLTEKKIVKHGMKNCTQNEKLCTSLKRPINFNEKLYSTEWKTSNCMNLCSTEWKTLHNMKNCIPQDGKH